MQVSKIKAYLQTYRDWQLSDAGLAFRPLWETQLNWQTHFELTAKDLKTVYSLALDNKTNRRHYSRSGFNPKVAMLEMLDWEPEHVRTIFEDLFNEERNLEGRIQRFVFYCRELFNQYRDARPKSKLADHYHDHDYHMASIYLTGQYPAKYAPYSTELLQQVLTKLGALDIPPSADFPRYTKLLITLRQFLVNDEHIMQHYSEEFLRSQDYQEESALLVWHFMQHITKEEE
ncbi:MAG: hypothetical protein AAFU03_02710 [Bacteroidota bacterium]